MQTGMLIAGPNLTIDRTGTIAELRPGDVLRFERVVVTPGGKGLNVARAARALGADALLVGFVPGETGGRGAAMIEREGIALRPVACGGELRSTAIVIEHGGRTTVLNEPGPRDRTTADWDALEAAVAAALGEHGVLVCSGSVPPGSPGDALRAAGGARGRRGRPHAWSTPAGPALARSARRRGRTSSARTSPRPRRCSAPPPAPSRCRRRRTRARARWPPRRRSSPAARAARSSPPTPPARRWRPRTAPAHWLPAPRIANVRNPIGAGDVLASGLAAALERGEPLLEAARRGVAAAAASVESPTAGELDAGARGALLDRLLERA